MCTNFDRSAYEIMRRFDNIQPKSSQELYDELYKARARILLGATTSLTDFLSTLRAERKLELREDGYVLTTSGVREREELKRVIGKAG